MNKSQVHPNNEPLKDKKVALVHDFLVCQGGAEKVLLTLAELFPEAPIYTLLYDKKAMRGMFADRNIRPSFLQKFPKFLKKRYRFLLPFFPVAVEAFDLREFDVVISSSGAWGKGIVTRLNTKHIAYIHSPMRYVWDYNEQYLREIGGGRFSLFKRMLLSYLRVWDREAADRPDALIANSIYTQSRIAKYYRRDSRVIYPPVVTRSNRQDMCHCEEHSDVAIPFDTSGTATPCSQRRVEKDFFGFRSKEYFVVVSRLTPNKKVSIAVEAFNKLGLPLIVVGEGSQKQYLTGIAKSNIKMVGWQDEVTLSHIYQHARALIFPAEDDFGIVMVEAMQYGLPIIAYGEGGAREIVTEGVTGEFFRSQTPEILADGVHRFLEGTEKYDAEHIRSSAERFSQEKFEQDFLRFLRESIEK
jgi:glycosyltransferase involved in cell wall biosynthesis